MNSFPKVKWMGRVTGRKGIVWESSLGASSSDVMESTPCLSLAAAISCFPGRSEGILSPCATAQSEESVCNLWNAKSFLFSLLLLFPRFSHCNLTVGFLCDCAPSHLKGAGAEFWTPLCNMLSSSQLFTPCCGPHCFGFLMRRNCYQCVNRSFCLSRLPLFCGFWCITLYQGTWIA